MTQPLVSVITPSYQQGQFIQQTIDSVLSQTYRHLEYIVMDGGSQDGTLDVLKRYNDPRMTWVSEKDGGQTNAINKGLRWAKGEIVTWINSDDMLTPDAVAFAVDYLQKHPNSSGIYGDCVYHDAQGKVVGYGYSAPFDLKVLRINQPGLFWRYGVTQTIGELDESLNYAMDTEYWWRIACAGFQLEYVPGVRAVYRLHGASKTVSQEDGFLQDLKRIYDKVYQREDLPAHVQAARLYLEEYITWRETKYAWVSKDYARARPSLWRFLFGKKHSRRLLASTMLLDSYLRTRLTYALDALYTRFRGVPLLGFRQA